MMMDNVLWWWEFNIFQDIKYDQIRNKYEKHMWMVLIHPHLIVIGKKRQDPHQRQNKVDILRGPQFAFTRYTKITKITKITKDKQNTIKLLHSAWFNDTWLNYMDPLWLSPWFTSAELQVIEIDMSNIDRKASRLNPSADCTAALEGFSFQPQCMQHSIQFPAVQSTGKKTKHRQDGQSYSLAPCDAMWFQSADFFYAILFWIKALDFC